MIFDKRPLHFICHVERSRDIFTAILLSLLLLLTALPAFSVEFGAILSDRTNFKLDGENFDKKTLDQRETLSPSLKAELGKSSNLSAEASVQHKIKSDLDGETDNNIILDLALLKFDKTMKIDAKKTFYLALGRMPVSDLTGAVFSQTSDGLYMKFSSPRLEASAYGGYTGILNKKNNSILTSSGTEFVIADEKKIYDFAAPYAVAKLNIGAPYLFFNQSLSFEAMGFFAVAGPSELPDGEDNRLYATVMLNGALASPLFYSISGTLQTTDFSKLGLLAKFDMRYFSDFKKTTVGLSAVYASSDSGAFSPFVGFTKIASCLSATEPVFSGIFKAALACSMKPTEKIFASVGFDAVLSGKEDLKYHGFQAAAALRLQIFSDLQLSLSGNIFIGDDKADNRADFTLGAAIAL